MPAKKTSPKKEKVPFNAPLKFDPKFEASVSFRTCKDKAIILGCWLYRHDVPFRFIACSSRPTDEVNHCILQLQDGKFIDANYPNTSFPSTLKYYKITPLTDWIAKEDPKMLLKNNLKKLNVYLKKQKGPFIKDKIEKSVPKLRGYIISEHEHEDEESRLKAILKKRVSFFQKLQDLKEISDKRIGKEQKYPAIRKWVISKQTFHDIYRNDSIPSKDTVLKFAFVLKASFDEAKTLLGNAGYAFGDCIYRDLILKFCFENKITNIDMVNEMLTQHKQKTLETQRYKPRNLVVVQ
jgi:hypothetical protein